MYGSIIYNAKHRTIIRIIQKSLWFYNSFLKNNNKNIQQTYIHCL